MAFKNCVLPLALAFSSVAWAVSGRAEVPPSLVLPAQPFRASVPPPTSTDLSIQPPSTPATSAPLAQTPTQPFSTQPPSIQPPSIQPPSIKVTEPAAAATVPVPTSAPSVPSVRSAIETSQAAPVQIAPTQAAIVPAPGSAATSASSLLTPESPTIEPNSTRGTGTVAQIITPGRATRSSSSYFGVGGNIGILGDSTAVGNGSFVILSKIGLTDRFSARPAVLFGDNITILLPLTYDFASVGSVGDYSVAPYVGGGFAIATDSDDTFNLLATAGVDIPLGSQFTANAAFNVTFLNRVSFGLLLGVGYNF